MKSQEILIARLSQDIAREVAVANGKQTTETLVVEKTGENGKGVKTQERTKESREVRERTNDSRDSVEVKETRKFRFSGIDDAEWKRLTRDLRAVR